MLKCLACGRKLGAAILVVCMLMLPVCASAVGIGDYLSFGSYEQDNDLFNGKEPIEWLILKSNGSEVLLISRYALDCHRFDGYGESVNWQYSELRQWLNTDFFNAAFSAEEQAAIVQSTVFSNAGEPTTDAVFLMSKEDSLTWFDSNAARTAVATAFARAQGVPDKGAGKCWYWLRDRGAKAGRASYINSSGLVCGGEGGISADTKTGAIRPLVWVSISALIQ
ncbi:MAG: hypothetical protein E7316_04865 [Clostridiales bacterium]|nr:hypothetical protein [Clostridiales bacterium]